MNLLPLRIQAWTAMMLLTLGTALGAADYNRPDPNFLRAPGTPAAGAEPAATVKPVKRPAPVSPATKQAPLAVAKLQAALDRAGFGVGFIDDRSGPRTQNALRDFAMAKGLSETAARELLAADDQTPPFITYIVTDNDMAAVGRAPTAWEEAAKVPAMAYESVFELLAEKFHAKPAFLAQLNPQVRDWDGALAGTEIRVPNIASMVTFPEVTLVIIDTHEFRLRAYDAASQLVFSVPVSIAKDRLHVPAGELRIKDFAPNPTYTFDPANFPESPKAQAVGHKLIIPPGPNNPVGVCWLSLSLPGFGIHGTPHPETIGSMESHGCFRLTNWDILVLSRLITPGVPIRLDVPAPSPNPTPAQTPPAVVAPVPPPAP